MGKSSSYSRQKKRSKASSQARKRKGSKIRSRKDKSKKLRRHFSDEDDSISLTSGSSSYSSSYEDDKYRSKSSRIRTRKDLKSRKKRATRRSYSSESSRDSPHASKRKVSKRKREYEKKTKTYSKKKRRRDYSTSSTSSESWSCSTCQSDGSSSSHDVELERHQSKRGKEERDKRILGEVESASKRSRYRSSPSRSHCSESSAYQSEERIWVENNSRRLRSIIIVAERDKEEEDRDLSKDEDKEEIIHIHGEYPSCRSNDSNDVGNKWEEGDHSSQDEVEKVRLENEKGDDTAVSDLGSRKHTESGNVSDDNVGSRFDGSKPSFDERGTTNTVNVDDLESVLRQKALENLRRLRGGLQTRGRTTNPNNKSEGDAKQSSVAIAESVQTRSGMEDDTRVVGGNFSKNDVTEVVSTETQSGKGVGVPETGKDTSDSSQIDKNMTDRNTCENESVFAKQNVARSVHQTANSGNSKHKVSAGISEVQPKLATPASTQQLSESSSTPKKAPEREDPRTNSLLSKTSLDEAVAVSAPTVTQNSNNNNNADISNASSSAAFEPSSLISASVETGYDKLQDEAHEGSQFEQKTMSVMRGGEMVKVSYKVYIPKKAPALARRQLKR